MDQSGRADNPQHPYHQSHDHLIWLLWMMMASTLLLALAVAVASALRASETSIGCGGSACGGEGGGEGGGEANNVVGVKGKAGARHHDASGKREKRQVGSG